MTEAERRAAALQAAATWQPWTPGVPERDAIAGLLALAETFAAWIETGEQQCDSAGSGATSPSSSPWSSRGIAETVLTESGKQCLLRA